MAHLLVMGGFGYSDGLTEFVRAIGADNVLHDTGAILRIAGEGPVQDEVADAIRGTRIDMLGPLCDDELRRELRTASLGIVVQRRDVHAGEVPATVHTYMRHSLPVLAAVGPESACARIVEESGAGWLLEPDLALLPARLREILAHPHTLQARGRAGHAHVLHQLDAEPTAGMRRSADVLGAHRGAVTASRRLFARAARRRSVVRL